jgi:hypothetical protein
VDSRVIVAALACAISAAWAAPAEGAIALRGAATANTGANPAATVTITAPAGLAVDDVMVATIVLRATGNTVTPPAGWSAVTGANVAAGVVLRQITFVKVTTAADVAAGSFAFDLGGTSRAAGGLLAYSGVDTATPIDVAASTASAAAGISATAPAVTTTYLRAKVLAITGWASNAPITPDPATTERYEDASTNLTATNNAAVEAAVATQTNPGSTGTFTATGASVRWIAQTVALNEMPELTASFPSAYSWPALVPGTTATSAEQTVSVTSNRSWGLQLASDAADGRSRQWNGSIYKSLTLTNAMQWRTSSIAGNAQATSFASLSGTNATAVTGQAPAAGAVAVGVTFRQQVSYADEAALPVGHTYRQNISYTAQQGF